MSEDLIVSPQEKTSVEEPEIVLEEKAIYRPKYESSVPKKITDAILEEEDLPKPMFSLGSSIIENFILSQIEKGVIDTDEMIKTFDREEMQLKIKEFVEKVKNTSNSLAWENIFTQEDAKNTQGKIITEMERLGIKTEETEKLKEIEIKITDGIGASGVSDSGDVVYVNKLQIVRKAIDYMSVFGNEIPLEQVIKSLIMATTGHELGHCLDKNYSNQIPLDEEWKINGRSAENRSERFAEYWGIVAVEDDPTLKLVRKRADLIILAKVSQLWDRIAQYNTSHDKKVDLINIYSEIYHKFKDSDKDLTSLLSARWSCYAGHEWENYASPYSREIVETAVLKR